MVVRSVLSSRRWHAHCFLTRFIYLRWLESTSHPDVPSLYTHCHGQETSPLHMYPFRGVIGTHGDKAETRVLGMVRCNISWQLNHNFQRLIFACLLCIVGLTSFRCSLAGLQAAKGCARLHTPITNSPPLDMIPCPARRLIYHCNAHRICSQ
jgi:hypothetical protein